MASQKPKQRVLERQPTCDEEQTKALIACCNERLVDAADIMKGEFLPKLAEENIPCFQELAPEQEVALARVLRWGSACSDSGGGKLVQEALASAYKN